MVGPANDISFHMAMSGDDVINRRIQYMGRRVGDLSPVWESLADLFREVETKQFDSEGQEFSGGWAPITADTYSRKVNAGLDERILRATGALFKSMTNKGDANAIEEIEPHKMRFGTSLPYAGFHQSPEDRKSNLPQRRIIEFNEEIRQTSMRMIHSFIRLEAHA